MDDLTPKAISVGSLVKKIMMINPNLDAPSVIEIVRQVTRDEGGKSVVDEARALELARATLKK